MGDYKNINIRNKRATFDYEIIEEFIAGVVLVGTEIKSIRLGKASLTDSYCYFNDGELWIRGVNIAEYGWGTCNNHTPKRDRKLLMHKREIMRLFGTVKQQGLTLIPLSLYFKGSLVKVQLGLCRGKQLHDKRATAAKRDANRTIDRALKEQNR